MVFFVAFAIDEWGAMKDSGVSLYAQDFWSWMDMGLIVGFFPTPTIRVMRNGSDAERSNIGHRGGVSHIP